MADNRKQNNKSLLIFLISLLLIVAVFVSGVLVGARLNRFQNSETTTDIPVGGTTEPNENIAGTVEATVPPTQFVPQPGFNMDSTAANGVVVTELTIFSAAYSHASGETWVRSLDGSNVVAPGTYGTHKVRLFNTGNCAMDYQLTIRDLFPDTVVERTVPIEVRLADSAGNYVIGGSNTWVALHGMQDVFDTGTLGKDCYTYYTLQWRWAFEAEEQDGFDTLLGNVTEEPVLCGLEITTFAQENPDPNAQGGLSAPQTGDAFRKELWFAVSGASLLVVALLLCCRPGDKKREKQP